MEVFILLVFVLGYIAITLEHNLRIDKLIPALLMMALAWAGIALGLDNFETWFNPNTHSMIEGFGSWSHEAKMEIFEHTLLHHFGKTCDENYYLLAHLASFSQLGYPVLVGWSRKSMIGDVLGVPVDERLSGSLAAATIALMAGAAVIRVHDVKESVAVSRIVSAVLAQRGIDGQ